MVVFENVGPYLRFTRDMMRFYRQRMAPAEASCALTRPEGDVLLFLANSPQLDTARDACEYRGFSKAYVSRAVEGLCVRGFLTVMPDKTDRRVQHLRLQPAAEASVAQLQQAQRDFCQALTEGVSEGDRQLLERVMEQMRRNTQ